MDSIDRWEELQNSFKFNISLDEFKRVFSLMGSAHLKEMIHARYDTDDKVYIVSSILHELDMDIIKLVMKEDDMPYTITMDKDKDDA